MQKQGGAKGDVKPSDAKSASAAPAAQPAKVRLHHGGAGRRVGTTRARLTVRLGSGPPPGATRERFHVPAQGSGRPLSDRLFGWARGAEKDTTPAPDSAPSTERTVPTKAFSRFLHALSLRDSPIVLDLGPIVGGNVNFLGERLGCKYLVEDLYQNIESHVASKNPPDLAAFFEKRFPQADASVDGVLCWDVLDYLDRLGAGRGAADDAHHEAGRYRVRFFANAPSTDKEYRAT